MKNPILTYFIIALFLIPLLLSVVVQILWLLSVILELWFIIVPAIIIICLSIFGLPFNNKNYLERKIEKENRIYVESLRDISQEDSYKKDMETYAKHYKSKLINNKSNIRNNIQSVSKLLSESNTEKEKIVYREELIKLGNLLRK